MNRLDLIFHWDSNSIAAVLSSHSLHLTPTETIAEPVKCWLQLPRRISVSPPPPSPHLHCIDHNNVSGDTPFLCRSSETEYHKPFTSRPPMMDGRAPQQKNHGAPSHFIPSEEMSKERQTTMYDSLHMTLNESSVFVGGKERRWKWVDCIYRCVKYLLLLLLLLLLLVPMLPEYHVIVIFWVLHLSVRE